MPGSRRLRIRGRWYYLPRTRLRATAAANSFDQDNDRKASGRVSNHRKGLSEAQRLRVGKEALHGGRVRRRSGLYAIEQRPHRDPEDFGNANEPAAADAIGALAVRFPCILQLYLMSLKASKVVFLNLRARGKC